MKRELIANIKFLAREVSQEWPHEEMVELPDVLKEIDQLDESETLSIDKEQLIKRIENYIPLHDKTAEDVVDGILRIIKQLPETEVLSQEWVDRNKEPFHYFGDNKVDYYVSTDFLQRLLVPKQSV